MQEHRTSRPMRSLNIENAGFNETSWRPLVGSWAAPIHGLATATEHSLPTDAGSAVAPIVGRAEVALSSPVRQRSIGTQQAKSRHARVDIAESDVRTASGEQPVSKPVSNVRRDQTYELPAAVEQPQPDDESYDYYAP